MLQTLAQREESLPTHQIDLKTQNEELIRSEAELSEARSRYFDLYNLAPVGYCTVSEKGLILDVNLTGSSMLGLPRSKLARRAFSRLILKEDQSIYHQRSTVLLSSRLPQECEPRLALHHGAALWLHLMSSVEQEAQGAPLLRVVISDITARKKTELAWHEAHVELEKLVNYTKLYQNERLVAASRLVSHDACYVSLKVRLPHTADVDDRSWVGRLGEIPRINWWKYPAVTGANA